MTNEQKGNLLMQNIIGQHEQALNEVARLSMELTALQLENSELRAKLKESDDGKG